MQQKRQFIVALVVAATDHCPNARARNYQEPRSRLVETTPPGTATDTRARELTQLRPIVDDMRSGTLITLAETEMSRSKSVGYPLIFAAGTNKAAAPLLLKRPPYDLRKDSATKKIDVTAVPDLVMRIESSRLIAFHDRGAALQANLEGETAQWGEHIEAAKIESENPIPF